LTVRFHAGGMQEMCWHLFTWGTAVVVIEPEELRLHLAELAETVAAHHGVPHQQPHPQRVTSED
jgi:predicted DNA-binding transcriptional regulator YafY